MHFSPKFSVIILSTRLYNGIVDYTCPSLPQIKTDSSLSSTSIFILLYYYKQVNCTRQFAPEK